MHVAGHVYAEDKVFEWFARRRGGDWQPLEPAAAVSASDGGGRFRGVEWSRGGPAVLLAGKDGMSPPIWVSVYAEPDALQAETTGQLLELLNGERTDGTEQ